MISGHYFDGVSPIARPAQLRIMGDSLCLATDAGELQFELTRCDLGEAPKMAHA